MNELIGKRVVKVEPMKIGDRGLAMTLEGGAVLEFCFAEGIILLDGRELSDMDIEEACG